MNLVSKLMNVLRLFSNLSLYISPFDLLKVNHTRDQCGKSFTLKGQLKEHMEIHTEVKPHTCDQCGRSFTRKGNLEDPMKVHTGEKLHICTFYKQLLLFNSRCMNNIIS